MLFTLAFVILSIFLVRINPEEFEVEFQWSHINFTWESQAKYQEALRTKKYIPENIFPTGLKLHRDRVYLATPKYREGVPVSLSYIPQKPKNKTNVPLVPFPSWSYHADKNCSNLQNVQTLEIDPKGIMWVLDGVRVTTTSCPPKLLQFDLNREGSLIHTFNFPNEVALQNGAYLNDLVLDGDTAYITDASSIDPGLIVYSRSKDRAWKLRDSSMFAEKDGPKFTIDNRPVVVQAPIDGIALSPIGTNRSRNGRIVFYAPLTGYSLFGVSTGAITDEQLYKNGSWRHHISPPIRKQGSTDGMMMDNAGNLYYSLISKNAVGKWNINKPFCRDAKIIYQSKLMVWPDAFGMDDKGYLYVIANRAYNYLDTNVKLNFTSAIKFRIFKYRTGTKSYQYP
ncbi:hypothetical protein JTB14_006223 [Gonioctena quinquepunctata]|nr:hypothetical protein JTB14_006223 [Gonioctena quinquepunctata]